MLVSMTASDTNGIIKSFVFPGLWLDTAALLTGEITGVAD